MNLTKTEIELFYKLWYAMVWGINEKHKVIPSFKEPQYGTQVSVSIEEFMKVRTSMWDNPEWIDEFLAENDNGEFSNQERNIMKKWRKHFIKGDFLIVKHMSKYTAVMTFEEKPVYVYAVYGISEPIKDALPYPVPFTVNLVLLPWEDKIIYDSLAMISNTSYGSDLRTSINGWYVESKKKYGMIKNLEEEKPTVAKNKKSATNCNVTKEVLPQTANVPKAMVEKYNAIADIITQFSDELLNEEYKELCHKTLAKLCRKRPSPLLKGRVDIGLWNYLCYRFKQLHF